MELVAVLERSIRHAGRGPMTALTFRPRQSSFLHSAISPAKRPAKRRANGWGGQRQVAARDSWQARSHSGNWVANSACRPAIISHRARRCGLADRLQILHRASVQARRSGSGSDRTARRSAVADHHQAKTTTNTPAMNTPPQSQARLPCNSRDSILDIGPLSGARRPTLQGTRQRGTSLDARHPGTDYRRTAYVHAAAPDATPTGGLPRAGRAGQARPAQALHRLRRRRGQDLPHAGGGARPAEARAWTWCSASSRPTAARRPRRWSRGWRWCRAAGSSTAASASRRWTSTRSSRASPAVAVVDELAHTNVPRQPQPQALPGRAGAARRRASTSSAPSTCSTWRASTTWSSAPPASRCARPSPTASSSRPTRW